MAKRRKKKAKAKANPGARWESMTYGVLPSKKKFLEHYRAEMGDQDFSVLLRGKKDTSAARGTIFAEAVGNETLFDEEDLWHGIKQLARKWDDGDDDAGDLASSILYTLNFEWI